MLLRARCLLRRVTDVLRRGSGLRKRGGSFRCVNSLRLGRLRCRNCSDSRPFCAELLDVVQRSGCGGMYWCGPVTELGAFSRLSWHSRFLAAV